MDPATVFIGAIVVILGIAALWYRYLWYEELAFRKKEAEEFRSQLEARKNERIAKGRKKK